MEKRRQINACLVQWIKNRAETAFAGDVSLVLLYGSYVNGTDNARSDVDCYFIPKTDRGYQMAADFILDGVGYDLFPMSWERVEGIAALNEVLLPLVGDVQILYCDSEMDLTRFRQLQNRLKENLRNKAYCEKIVEKKFAQACVWCAEMHSCLSSAAVRKLAGGVLMALADAVALHNGDYFHYGLKRQYDDLHNRFADVPEDFLSAYDGVIRASDDASFQACSLALLKAAGAYLGLAAERYQPAQGTAAQCQHQKEKNNSDRNLLPENESGSDQNQHPVNENGSGQNQHPVNENGSGRNQPPDYPSMAALYEEICSTFQKIYVCSGEGNAVLAFLSAVCLQSMLDEAAEDYGGHKYDLLDAYRFESLEDLAQRAHFIEEDFVRTIEQGGGVIKRFDSVEALLQSDIFSA